MPTAEEYFGWAGEAEAEAAWEAIGDQFASFFIAGSEGKTRTRARRWWEVFQQVTSQTPNLQPQPTGNCVAASARDAVELLQAIEILKGDRETWEALFDPFHYATGRVLIGQNKLKGGAGSIGSWQSKAIEEKGVLRKNCGKPLPKYSKENVNAWGDGNRSQEGLAFTDFLSDAADFVVKTTARVRTLAEIIEALDNGYICTIAANFGINKLPTGGKKGFHKPNGEPCPHQKSIWGYDLEHGSMGVKNQWGDVHGELEDLETGEPWPRGFMRLTMEDMERHIKNAEVMVYSNFEGFPAQTFDYGNLG